MAGTSVAQGAHRSTVSAPEHTPTVSTAEQDSHGRQSNPSNSVGQQYHVHHQASVASSSVDVQPQPSIQPTLHLPSGGTDANESSVGQQPQSKQSPARKAVDRKQTPGRPQPRQAFMGQAAPSAAASASESTPAHAQHGNSVRVAGQPAAPRNAPHVLANGDLLSRHPHHRSGNGAEHRHAGHAQPQHPALHSQAEIGSGRLFHEAYGSQPEGRAQAAGANSLAQADLGARASSLPPPRPHGIPRESTPSYNLSMQEGKHVVFRTLRNKSFVLSNSRHIDVLPTSSHPQLHRA